MMRQRLIPGLQRARLTILERLPKKRLRCQCDCGTITTIAVNEFGRTASCGCFRRELGRDRMRTLRLRHDRSHTVEYGAWHNMKNRCLNPRDRVFQYYGGRGIAVCPQWCQSFETFFADVGPRPSPNHSLSRLDNDGHYEPGNVCWETSAIQTRNRRSTRLLTAFGKTQCMTDWATEYHLHIATLARRLRVGIPLEHALVSPLNQLGPDPKSKIG